MRSRAQSRLKETASDEFRPPSSKARVRRKVPGLFVCPAGGIGIRACLRNMEFRVRIPGGVPDFFRKRMRFRAAPAMRPDQAGSFFYNLGCGTYRAGIAQREERDVASVEARVRVSLAAPFVSVV